MTNGQLNLIGESVPKTDKGRLLVKDVARYLSGLAKLHEEDKTGNPELSKGLRQVAQALRPFASYPAAELAEVIGRERNPSAFGNKATSRKPKVELPRELEAMSQGDVTRILDDDRYTKQQIAELGFRRFGISRSKLESLRKKDAQHSVRAALDHEKSLDVIASQARKAGRARAG